ncbi:MAG: hypothetical protein SFH39_04040 [Candidatus Magnetobacterium sp. LHC-1]
MINQDKLTNNDIMIAIQNLQDHIDNSIKGLEERIIKAITEKEPLPPSKMDELLEDWRAGKKDEAERKLKKYTVQTLKDLCIENELKIKSKPKKEDFIKAIKSKLGEISEPKQVIEISPKDRESLQSKFNNLSRTWASGEEKEEEEAKEKEVENELEKYSDEDLKRLCEANYLEVKGELVRENILKAIYNKFRERRRYR